MIDEVNKVQLSLGGWHFNDVLYTTITYPSSAFHTKSEVMNKKCEYHSQCNFINCVTSITSFVSFATYSALLVKNSVRFHKLGTYLDRNRMRSGNIILLVIKIMTIYSQYMLQRSAKQSRYPRFSKNIKIEISQVWSSDSRVT